VCETTFLAVRKNMGSKNKRCAN